MPGQVASFTFSASAGQRVFVDVPTTNLPDQCGLPRLLRPDGSGLVGGCPIGGKGYVQSEPLDASGTYTVAIDPDVPATGQATLRVFVTSDRNEGTVGVNGAPVTGTIDRPGQQVAWTFSGTSGQRLSVDVSAATLADECNVLAVMAPDRSTVSTGCIIGGKGSLGPATLPATGTYTLVLHASDGNTGRATLRVTSS